MDDAGLSDKFLQTSLLEAIAFFNVSLRSSATGFLVSLLILKLLASLESDEVPGWLVLGFSGVELGELSVVELSN